DILPCPRIKSARWITEEEFTVVTTPSRKIYTLWRGKLIDLHRGNPIILVSRAHNGHAMSAPVFFAASRLNRYVPTITVGSSINRLKEVSNRF
ncbi:MAG: hypothetical protein QF368_19100, partial [SAR202 cluster bacterium]|nr:hypothetical protein [SAR202 cluster bacterium]